MGLFVHTYSTIPLEQKPIVIVVPLKRWSLCPSSSKKKTRKITLHRDLHHVRAPRYYEVSISRVQTTDFLAITLSRAHQPSFGFFRGPSCAYTCDYIWNLLKGVSQILLNTFSISCLTNVRLVYAHTRQSHHKIHGSLFIRFYVSVVYTSGSPLARLLGAHVRIAGGHHCCEVPFK